MPPIAGSGPHALTHLLDHPVDRPLQLLLVDAGQRLLQGVKLGTRQEIGETGQLVSGGRDSVHVDSDVTQVPQQLLLVGHHKAVGNRGQELPSRLLCLP